MSRDLPSTIGKDQIKIIHTLKSKLGIEDGDYRLMLAGYNVQSSTRLSFNQAVEFTNTLAIIAEQKGVYTKKKPSRNDYAYPAQIYKIRMLWASKSFMNTEEAKEKALNKFLANKFKISRIEWLPREMVGKVIKSIESIKRKD